jgi:hypothetical protein
MGDERLEGSRFGACHKNLALFLTSRGQPQKREIRRLPRITQRAVSVPGARKTDECSVGMPAAVRKFRGCMEPRPTIISFSEE